MLILFEKTHSLSNILQSKHLNIIKAIEFAEITISNFLSIKTEMDSSVSFDEMYQSSEKTCDKNGIEVQSNQRPLKRRRDQDNFQSNIKETYDNIIDLYVEEIQKRFNRQNLEPVMELYNIIMIADVKQKINFGNLKIYRKFIDFDKLKFEIELYVQYKIKNNKVNWNSFEDLADIFVKNELKNPFEHACIKLYFIFDLCMYKVILNHSRFDC